MQKQRTFLAPAVSLHCKFLFGVCNLLQLSQREVCGKASGKLCKTHRPMRCSITLQEKLLQTCSLGCKCADKSPFSLHESGQF